MSLAGPKTQLDLDLRPTCGPFWYTRNGECVQFLKNCDDEDIMVCVLYLSTGELEAHSMDMMAGDLPALTELVMFAQQNEIFEKVEDDG